MADEPDVEEEEEEEKGLEPTDMLRRMWTQAAAGVLSDIREQKPVGADRVNELQRGLENIERREDFEGARELTRKTPRGRPQIEGTKAETA